MNRFAQIKLGRCGKAFGEVARRSPVEVLGQNRVFIIFTVEEVMETLRCRSEKAVRLFAELDSKKGIGLIERKRQGLGKPAIIYVNNLAGDIS